MLPATLWAQPTEPATITTAVPFLRVAPDSRGAAMGDAGVASSADVHSIYWNPAKLVFAPGGKGVSLSYSPWLSKMAANMWLSQLTGFFTLPDGKQAIGASLVYFSQGTINLKDQSGLSSGSFQPREMAFTTTYSRKLSEKLSMAASLRYVHSSLFGTIETGLNGKTGYAVAGDVGVFFQTDSEAYQLKPVNFSLGATISNLGTKINYGGDKYYLPTNLRLGGGVTFRFGNHGRLSVILDANKLMVPSPPQYLNDNRSLIYKGKDPERKYFSGVFGSFADSPEGMPGELREFTLSGGLEFWANPYIGVRAGYFSEPKAGGDRKYYTAGAGFNYKGMGVDIAYLIPQQQNHPLAETFRVTLTLTPQPEERRNSLVYSNYRRTARVRLTGQEATARKIQWPTPVRTKAPDKN